MRLLFTINKKNMLQFFLEAFMFGIGSGICAAVYLQVLAYEKILNWWFRFGARFEGRWFYDPIWGCIKCIAGQIALWAYVFAAIIPAWLTQTGRVSTIEPPALYYPGNPFLYLYGVVMAICISIFVGMLCARVVTILTKN